MTEHVHEWKFDAASPFAWCECIKTLGFQEIERRLNEYETLKKATDVLSAEDARTIAEVLGNNLFKRAVLAYANILEGKDE